ncbi:hypothetical protein DH2020_035552 [Rehmannia glutinosa]|uniref:FLZ-type domain-containing protein n=1 Tax=Rehmannia glutinosa TaxID=99300 RepID=A0ABR0V7Z0_REHGL
MMLGKRGRPPMKRTTSMTEFTLDLNGAAESVNQPSDPNNPFNGGSDQRYLVSAAVVSPKPQRRNSADLVQIANFLRVCSLCKRRLIPGRDIYMYRYTYTHICIYFSNSHSLGDSAFCSLECRQQKMTQDERKENCSSASKMEAGSAAAGAKVSAAV